MTKPPAHNHLTRDIKPLGQCPACDKYHDRHIPKPPRASVGVDSGQKYFIDSDGKMKPSESADEARNRYVRELKDSGASADETTGARYAWNAALEWARKNGGVK